MRHARGRETPVGRWQAALAKGLRLVRSQLAKCLSWQDTARIFDTAWDTVHRAAGMAVDWDRARISMKGVTGTDRSEQFGIAKN